MCVYDSLNRLDMLTTILFFYIPAYLSYILNNADIDFDSSTLLSEAIIGAFAGGWGAFLTNPTDIITTRIITQSVDEEDIIDEDGNIISKPPLGVIEMGKKLYKEGGPAAFFVGWQARGECDHLCVCVCIIRIDFPNSPLLFYTPPRT